MTSAFRLRRALLLAPAVSAPLAVFGQTGAAPPRTYAVLSLVGDRFDVVKRRMATGSHIEANDVQVLPVDAPVLDDVATTAAERAIAADSPAASRLRFSIRDARLFALQDKLLVAGAESDGLREALRGLLAKAGASHLLLLTKRRDEARFSLADGGAGGGKIGGVGFYIDNLVSTRHVDTGEASRGYVAAFALVTASLVEASTMRLLASRNGFGEHMTTPSESRTAAVAWEATTPAQKSQQLDRVIDRAVFAATRDVLAVR